MTATAPTIVDPISTLDEALQDARRVREEAEADLAALDEEGEQTTEQLLRIDQRVASGPLRGPALTRARNRRRKLREQREDAATDRHIYEQRVVEARLRENQATVALNHALRVGVQSEGAEVAEEIRSLVGQMEGLFARWRSLADVDRISCDILRGLDTEAMNRLPTFSWATATDGHMTEAITNLIALKRRAEADLAKRAAAARGNG